MGDGEAPLPGSGTKNTVVTELTSGGKKNMIFLHPPRPKAYGRSQARD